MKNKFITFIILLILGVIGAGLYSSYLFKNSDRDSFVLLIEGAGLLNEQVLEVEKRENLYIGDIISTQGDNSLVIIEWGDGSLTRLGGNSTIEIKELFITHDLSMMNISFELLSGKSWSNVISFFGEDSYFKEYFMDSEASVRGTVFDVDLENEYIYVLDHEVTLTTNDKSFIIGERDPFSLKTFSFIQLEKFIRDIKNQAWEALNDKYDTEYLEILKQEALEKFKENIILKKFDEVIQSEDLEKLIGTMSESEKQELYNKLLIEYQKINFIKSSDDGMLFLNKIKLKEVLLATASNDNKKVLIQSIMFDFKETIQSKNFNHLDSILPILKNHSDILKELDIKFSDYFDFNILPDDLKQIMLNNLESLKNIFGQSVDLTKFKNISVDDIKSRYNSIKNNTDKVIHGVLDSLINK
ncbi:FecR domain-containing protein [Candidatus Gracilibacteria bacterium 28_42_T64]|nr:FecR domain-containing protein [Candidatus Gracilibacteria bacterium 28_42_T64]